MSRPLALCRSEKPARKASCCVAFAWAVIVLSGVAANGPARADEGGVSFWLPGLFGSLAATPQTPGFSFTTMGYHTSVKADGAVAFARQVTRGNITANFFGGVTANLQAQANLAIAVPSYVFETPIFGAQANILMLVPYGRSSTDVDARLFAAVGPFGFTRGSLDSDSVTGFGDLAPQFNLRWNMGAHNVMTYVTGNIPVGRYSSTRLANLGLGHQSVDAGAGYTYFNPHTGWEFSSTLGFTYNFENKDTQYQNGVDSHLDWGASRFITPTTQIGLVGYVYKQLSCDSGAGDRVGCFKSQVAGIGPQIAFILPMGPVQGYLNFKAYKEFAAENRPEGWNAWVTLSLTPPAKKP